jgi:hypothetical protein
MTINGEAAPDGTPIEALIGDLVCGTTTTSDGRYGITVNGGYGMGNQFQEGCGNGGEAVVFRSGQLIANQRGQFLGGLVQTLDLTFGPAGLPDTGSGPAPGSGADFVPGLLWILLGVAMAALIAALAARKAAR